jgi:hypothetical protein
MTPSLRSTTHLHVDEGRSIALMIRAAITALTVFKCTRPTMAHTGGTIIAPLVAATPVFGVSGQSPRGCDPSSDVGYGRGAVTELYGSAQSGPVLNGVCGRWTLALHEGKHASRRLGKMNSWTSRASTRFASMVVATQPTGAPSCRSSGSLANHQIYALPSAPLAQLDIIFRGRPD